MEARNPDKLWQAFGELIKEDVSFCNSLKINLIGQIDQSVRKSIADNGLDNHVSLSGYVPHNHVATINKNSSVLLLTLNPDSKPLSKGLVPAKLFEYLASGRPILCIGSEDGDAAHILNETRAGITVSFEDKEKMKETIQNLFHKFLENDLPDNSNVESERYSRRNLAYEYSILLNKTINN
jgi:glycosyltransferase involved in cell wall biosynthesis